MRPANVPSPGTGRLFAAPVNSDQNGELAIQVPGSAAVTDLVLQSLFLDAAVLPHNLAFTNAVLARFGN